MTPLSENGHCSAGCEAHQLVAFDILCHEHALLCCSCLVRQVIKQTLYCHRHAVSVDDLLLQQLGLRVPHALDCRDYSILVDADTLSPLKVATMAANVGQINVV